MDDLLVICPNEPDILLIRIYFDTQVAPEDLMNGFIKWVYPWKEYIKNRDEKYFTCNDHMFGPLPTSKVAYFKEKFTNGTFNDSDKKVLWDYFTVFISLIEKYNKMK